MFTTQEAKRLSKWERFTAGSYGFRKVGAAVALLVLLVLATPGYAQRITAGIVRANSYEVVPSVPAEATGGQVTPTQPGTNNYYYWIVTVESGVYSEPSGPLMAESVAAASISSPISISWNPIAGATYDLLRTTSHTEPSGSCTCALATGLTPSRFTDTGQTLANYSVSNDWEPRGMGPASPADATQYVSASGSDSYGGLSRGTAKATIAAALSALPTNASDYGHGAVYLGAGTYQISATVVIPAGTTVEGLAEASSPVIIQASPSFPTGTPLVELANSGQPEGVRLENVKVDCNNIAGAIGVENDYSQEYSGLSGVTMVDCPGSGLYLGNGSGSSAQGSTYTNIQILADANCTNCSTSTTPVYMETGAAAHYIHGLTINFTNAPVHPSVALTPAAGLHLSDAHCEGATTCFETDAQSIYTNLSCGGGSTSPNVTNCVDVNTGQNGFGIFGIVADAHLTNLVVDADRSVTIPSSVSSVPLYLVGSGALGSEAILTSDSSVPNILNQLTLFGALNVAGALTGSTFSFTAAGQGGDVGSIVTNAPSSTTILNLNDSSGTIGTGSYYLTGQKSGSNVWYVRGDGVALFPTLTLNNPLSTAYGGTGSSVGTSAGTISISAATSGSHNFGTPYPATPNCSVTPTSNLGTTTYWISTLSTSTLTITLSASSTATFDFTCSPAAN